MTTTRYTPWVALLLGLFVGCASMPKPKALVQFEALRAKGIPAGLAKEGRALLTRSEKAYGEALAAWKDQEADLASHFATLGTLALRIARERANMQRANDKLANLRAQLEAGKSERRSYAAQLARTEELITLHEELAVARVNTREKAMHLSEVREAASTRRHLGEAQLALKMAETVEAATHARALFSQAKALARRAARLVEQKKIRRARDVALQAKERALAAFKEARPRFLQKKKLAERRAQDATLQRDMAAIASKQRGISVRVVAAGGTQQLEVRVTFLFPPAKPAPHKKKTPTIEEIGSILKRYPKYPVMVRAYSSHRTPKKRRASLTQARAQLVRELLVGKGLHEGRLIATGAGASKLIGHRYNGINDRVTFVIPLAGDQQPTIASPVVKAPVATTGKTAKVGTKAATPMKATAPTKAPTPTKATAPTKATTPTKATGKETSPTLVEEEE